MPDAMAWRNAQRIDLADRRDGEPMFGEQVLGRTLGAAAGTRHQQWPLRHVGKRDRRGVLIGADVEQFLEHQRLDREPPLRPIDEQHRGIETAVE